MGEFAMLRWGRAVLIAALLSLTSAPGFGAGGSRAVTNLPDGRLLALVGARSQSISGIDGAYHIVADGIVIDFADGRLTVDGEPREVPVFESLLEIRIVDGGVVLTGDP
jgi:hypothetical protein